MNSLRLRNFRFGPIDYDNQPESPTRLIQNTIVYQEAFERLSHQVDCLLESFLIGCFIAKFQDDICLDVKIKQPKNSADTIGVARLIKERNQLQKTHPSSQ